MSRSSFVVVLGSLFSLACGPDGEALVAGEGDVDSAADSALTSGSQSATWFPVSEGNAYEFKSTSTGALRTVTITQVSATRALVTGLFAEPTWVGTSSGAPNTLNQWTGSAWQPFVRFGYASTSWAVGSGTCTGLKAKRVATARPVASAAGSFTDTRVIGFEQVVSATARCEAPAFVELTFAPKVGLVAFTTGRQEHFELAEATVAGATLPAGVTAAVTLDQSSYTSTPNTIRCITQPCPSNQKTAVAKVTLTVRNTTANPITWSFASGCGTDVELLTAAGALMTRLNQSRVCTQQLRDLTLAAGQTQTWKEELVLEDANHVQVEGTFTVRARVMGDAGRPAATAPLTVHIGG